MGDCSETNVFAAYATDRWNGVNDMPNLVFHPLICFVVHYFVLGWVVVKILDSIDISYLGILGDTWIMNNGV